MSVCNFISFLLWPRFCVLLTYSIWNVPWYFLFHPFYKSTLLMGGCIRKSRGRRSAEFNRRIPQLDSLDIVIRRRYTQTTNPESREDEEHSNITKVPSWLSFCESISGNDKTFYVENEQICPVCLENYNDRPNMPRVFPCGHTVCNICLRELSSEHDFKSAQCPIDRSTHVFKHAVAENPFLRFHISTGSTVSSAQDSSLSSSISPSSEPPRIEPIDVNTPYSIDLDSVSRSSVFSEYGTCTNRDIYSPESSSQVEDLDTDLWLTFDYNASPTRVVANFRNGNVCPVCGEIYDSDLRRLRFLPCGHDMCNLCLTLTAENLDVRCPFDGEIHRVHVSRHNHFYDDSEEIQSISNNREHYSENGSNGEEVPVRIPTPEFVRRLWRTNE